MADRPTASMSRAGRPRMRSRSAHLPSCIPVASKAVKPRTKSAQRAPEKGKGKSKSKGSGKGRKATKKLDKAATAAVVNSDSEDLEVDFPHHPPCSSMRCRTTTGARQFQSITCTATCTNGK